MRLGWDMMALLDVAGEVVGKPEEEVEHVWYGRLPNDGQLGELGKQSFVKRLLQEQSQGPMGFNRALPGVHTNLRVRRVNREGAVLTRKVRTEGQVGVVENSVEISDDVYDFFCHTFGEGINKMRYTIQSADMQRKLELDVFVDKFGHVPDIISAKYDFEVPKNQPDYPLPVLPITLIDQVHFNPFTCSDLDIKNLRDFMQRQTFRY